MDPFDQAAPQGSDELLLRRLHAKINARPKMLPGRTSYSTRRGRPRVEWLDVLWSYFEGNPPLPLLDQGRAEDLREFIRMGRANYASVTIAAMLDRISLLGVRTDIDGDADGDDEFRRILSMSGPWLRDALTFTFVLGEGMVMVGQGDDMPIVTAEDPRLCSYVTDPLDPSRVTSALKTYVDDEDTKHVHLFTGEPGQERVRVAVQGKNSKWEWDASRSGPLKVRGVGLPLVPLVNSFGRGEFEAHLDVLDRINNNNSDRLWTAKIQAFRQRALETADFEAESIDDMVDDDGEKVNLDDLFRASPDAMWNLPAGRKLWESTPVDLSGILLANRDDVKEYAAVSQTPLFMFTPDAASGSAEGASSMKENLELKCRDRIERFTPPVRRISRLILAYAGRPVPKQVEVQWGSVERYSLAQRTQAASQAKATGVPLEVILTEIMQWSPETVKRAMDARLNDLLAEAIQPSGVAPSAGV